VAGVKANDTQYVLTTLGRRLLLEITHAKMAEGATLAETCELLDVVDRERGGILL
jgi:hypothetical protein